MSLSTDLGGRESMDRGEGVKGQNYITEFEDCVRRWVLRGVSMIWCDYYSRLVVDLGTPSGIQDFIKTINSMENKSGGSQNIEAITLSVYEKHFLLESRHKRAMIEKGLVIDRVPGKIGETKSAPEGSLLEKRSFSVFLGIITVVERVFLLLGEHCRLVCSIDGQDIFELKTVHFVPFEQGESLGLFDSFVETAPPRTEDGAKVEEYIQGLRKLLQEGYYFSYGYDLTLSKAKQSQQAETQSHFLWNYNLFANLLNREIDERWLVPLIQGYVGHIQTYLASKRLDYFVISRRSKERAGTRYSHRGIDDEGNVANFVETEQLVYFNGYCMSHLQIRGSVPTFWQQVGVTASSRVQRNFELTNQAFVKHFDRLTQDYSRIVCVNLMMRAKKNEQLITETFEKHVQSTRLDNVKYEYFDFHHVCKGQQFQKVNPLIEKLSHLNKIFRFYVEDSETRTILLTQKGVVRSNCLDCLDRTNYFMTKMAAITFEQMLRQFDIDLKSHLEGKSLLQQLDTNESETKEAFVVAFKHLWADNGDTISLHYTGTGSTHTNVTRTGKRDIKGLLDHGKKTLGRFYMQNFQDSFKQQLIDLFLGNHLLTSNVFDVELQKELKARQREYSSYSGLSVQGVSWHCHHYVPSQNFDPQDLLGHAPLPDLLVLCLQGVAEQEVARWQKSLSLFLEGPEQKGSHRSLHCLHAQELLTLIFVKESLMSRVRNIRDSSVKLNLLSKQGATAVSLSIDDSELCIVNCLLDAGQKDMATRLAQLRTIHQSAFQKESTGITPTPPIGKHHFRILMGQLNFKIRLPDYEVRQYIESFRTQAKLNSASGDTLDYLYKQDEWQTIKEQERYLGKYSEAPISFLPTSKHEQFSSNYAGSATPSYDQRILVGSSANSHLSVQSYDSRPMLQSVSRPVAGLFQVEVKKVDQQLKSALTKQIYEGLDQALPEDDPQEMGLRRQVSFLREL